MSESNYLQDPQQTYCNASPNPTYRPVAVSNLTASNRFGSPQQDVELEYGGTYIRRRRSQYHLWDDWTLGEYKNTLSMLKRERVTLQLVTDIAVDANLPRELRVKILEASRYTTDDDMRLWLDIGIQWCYNKVTLIEMQMYDLQCQFIVHHEPREVLR